MCLQGAGLLHHPNLHLTALNAQDVQMTQSTPPAQPDLQAFCALLATLLGLPTTSTPQDLLAKLGTLQATAPDPAKYMPIAAVQEMLQDRRSERVQTDSARITSKIETAMREGYISPGMKNWALALCRSDEVAFDTFCRDSGPTFAYLFKESHAVGRGPANEPYTATPLEASICEQLGLKPDALRG
jgi:phage I-like protein